MTVPEEAWEKTLRERREEEEEKIETEKLEPVRKLKTYLAADILATVSLKPNTKDKAADTCKDTNEDLGSKSPIVTAAATAAGDKDSGRRPPHKKLKLVKSLAIPFVNLKMMH